MPVSTSHHRASIGTYQRKLHDNFRNNTIINNEIIKNHSATTYEIPQPGININKIINSHTQMNHHPIPSNIMLPLLMLLSQIRLPANLLLTDNNMSECINNKCDNVSTLSRRMTLDPDNSVGGIHTLLRPVLNTLNDAGNFIAHHDPLIFPVAAATVFPRSPTLEPKIRAGIQDNILNPPLVYALPDEHNLNQTIANTPGPEVNFFRESSSPSYKRYKRANVEQASNIAYQRYLTENCHIRTKTHQGTPVGDNLLIAGEMVRNIIRATAEKIYASNMGNAEMPPWLVTVTEIANLVYDIALGAMTSGSFPIIKYTSSKALTVAGQAVNGDSICIKNEFSREELSNLLFNIEVGVTNRRFLHPLSGNTKAIELSNANPVDPDGLPFHESPSARVNTADDMIVTHHRTKYPLEGHPPAEYSAYPPAAIQPDRVERKIYFDPASNQIRFASEIPEGLGLNFQINEGKKTIALQSGNYELMWNWKKSCPEIVIHDTKGKALYVPVYMEPLSKTWHLNIQNENPVFNSIQIAYIDQIKTKIDERFNYIPSQNNNQNYYGMGKIYLQQKIDDPSNYAWGRYIEVHGQLVPVRNTQHQGSGVLYEIYDIKNPSNPGHPIEWDGHRWLFERETSSHVSEKLTKIISHATVNRNIDPATLSAPDTQGLRYDERGRRHIKIEGAYIMLEKYKGHDFITQENGAIIHIEKINDEFRPKTLRTIIENVGIEETSSAPYQLIADKLKITEAEASDLINQYKFSDSSDFYTANTFSLDIYDSGKIPAWADDFKKLKIGSYISPFRKGKVMPNGLNSFTNSDGYFYRVDSTPPEEVLQYGFKESSDYSAIAKMLPEDEAGLIVSGNIQGALRYNTLAKSNYIYKIKRNNIRGVSLKDNFMTNQNKVKAFLDEPLDKEYTTLASFAEDCNGVVYLDEIHLNIKDIRVENISLLSKTEMQTPVIPGPWNNHF